jgi:hypothetical protein
MLLVGVPDSIWGYLHHVVGGMPQLEPAVVPALEPVKERAT